MQAYKENTIKMVLYVSDPLNDSLVFPANVGKRETFGNLIVLETPINIDFEKLLQSLNRKILKLFDRLFLVFPNDNAEDFVSNFFDYISKHNIELIDMKRNMSNIENLIKLLLAKISSSNPTIIDFGCGNGISNQIIETINHKFEGVNLLGYDISKQMLARSKESGLRTLTKNALLKTRDNSIDGVFASYVMHFLMDTEAILDLWKKIKIGGGIIANFHKDIGLERIIILVESLGGKYELIEVNEHGSIYFFYKIHNNFIRVDTVSEYLVTKRKLNVSQSILDILVQYQIVSTFEYNNYSYILATDLIKIEPFLSDIKSFELLSTGNILYQRTIIINTTFLTITMQIGSDIDIEAESIALLKNLFSLYTAQDKPTSLSTFHFGSSVRIQSISSTTNALIHKHLEKLAKIESTSTSIFANTASYMGSKKTLRPFIVEAISTYIDFDSKILDLMCGSGTVSGAFSNFWETYSSDALEFCRILATIQGGGFNIERANKIISTLKPFVFEKSNELKQIFYTEISTEDKIFHSEISYQLKKEYSDFCESFPKIEESSSKEFGLYYAQRDGKTNYLLFTCAYSNLYVGLRQAIEIDSYRYAIDKLVDNEDRVWALGALIATLSSLGNTYGGHFAQPYYKNIDSLSNIQLYKLIEQRNISVINEFTVRLKEFANESQKNMQRPVIRIEGPWQNAIIKFLHNKKNIVYLDAPYTRDEYSRYYHLLETLIKYHYPLINRTGRVPEKKQGERFNSDFFTKNLNKLKSVYIKIISDILKNGSTCVWSYSSNATIPCLEILYEIQSHNECMISSFSTPYTHNGQGGKRAKQIKEYLVIFEPHNTN